MLEVEQQPGGFALVGLIEQHPALGKQWLEPLQDQVDGCVEQRVAGSQQFGLRVARPERLVECDAGVAVEHGITAAN